MQINRNLAQALQKIDTDNNGVSLAELKKVDTNDDGEISEEEAKEVGLSDPKDIKAINNTYKQAQASPNLVFFEPVGPQPPPDFEPTRSPNLKDNEFANQATQNLTHQAFDSDNPDVSIRLQRLNFSLLNQRSQAMDGAFKIIQPDSNLDGITLTDLDGVKNYADIRSRSIASIGNSQDNPEAYLEANYNQVAAKLGDDLNDRYNGHVKMIGDADGITAFQIPGDEDIVVCTDIHASITAFHKANGNEAYTVSTTGNDAAHVFTIFKDPKSDKWNIQNYGTVVETDAKDIRELYDKYMPEQRYMRLYDVDETGSLKQARKVMTAVGMREWDFRNNLGVGDHNPLTAQQGIELSANGVSATFGGFNVNFNRLNNTLGLNYHTQKQEGNTQIVQGVAAEGQFDEQNGYKTQRADVKYERRSTTQEQHSEDHIEQTQHHVSVFTGVEQASGEPIYWRDTSDGSTPVGDNDTGVRIGAQYNHTNRHYFRLGATDLFFLTGHQERIGAAITLSASSSGADIYETYATRMYNDLNAEIKTPIGLAYMGDKVYFQGGILTGFDFANFDGIQNAGEQALNMFENEAFLEARYQPNSRFSLGVMSNFDLMHPGVMQLGAMTQVQITPELCWSTAALADIDPVLGNRGGVNTGLAYQPHRNVSMGVSGGISMDGRPMGNIGLKGHF